MGGEQLETALGNIRGQPENRRDVHLIFSGQKPDQLRSSPTFVLAAELISFTNRPLSREFADPIYFPGLAAVGGEGLFHPGGRRREVEPDVAHENGAAFEVFLMEKLAAIAGEVADHGRRGESSVIEVDEIDAPLTRGGVVEAEGLRLDAESFVGAGDVELFEVCVTVEKFLVVGDTVVLDPEGWSC